MKILTVLAAAAALTAPMAAQALNEPFDTSVTGVFPPAGWTLNLLPGHVTPEQWEDTAVTGGLSGSFAGSVSSADAAGHEYGIALSDDRLESPAMDLSSYGAPQLTYDGSLGWAAYMTHTSGGVYIGESHIEVSTDGGATWVSIWQEAALSEYYTVGITEDLSAYAGNASVKLGYHYMGDFAHTWGVDNVVVADAGPSGPSLAISGTCPGQVTANASGMTPNGPVGFGWGFAGSSVIAGGPCAGAALPVSNPTVLAIVLADANGDASLTGNAPANACGNALVVAVDGATCTATGAAAL